MKRFHMVNYRWQTPLGQSLRYRCRPRPIGSMPLVVLRGALDMGGAELPW